MVDMNDIMAKKQKLSSKEQKLLNRVIDLYHTGFIEGRETKVSLCGYFLALSSYFLRRSSMASSSRLLRGISVSAARYFSFFINSVSILEVMFFRAMLIY